MQTTPASGGRSGPASGSGHRPRRAGGGGSAGQERAAVGDGQELVPHGGAARAREGPVDRPPGTRGLSTLAPAGRHGAHRFLPLSSEWFTYTYIMQAHTTLFRRIQGKP